VKGDVSSSNKCNTFVPCKFWFI